MRVTKDWENGRVVTHTFPKNTAPDVIEAYSAAINHQLTQVRESVLEGILKKPVTHLTSAEQTKFYAINPAVIPYFYHELTQGHGIVPDFDVDYSSMPIRSTTVTGVPVAVRGFNDSTLAITHVSVEKDVDVRGDMLNVLLTTAHEMSHRFTFGGPVLFWNFVKTLTLENAQNYAFEGVRRGSMTGLQFYANLPWGAFILGEALENGMAARDSRNMYKFIETVANISPSSVSTDERSIQAAKKFEEEVQARKSFIATDAFKQQLDEINKRLDAKLRERVGVLTSEDAEPFMQARSNGTFIVNELSLFSYLLSRYVAQGIGAARFPGSSVEEQLAFGWSLMQEGRLKNPKNIYKLIARVFGPKHAKSLLSAREDSTSILTALSSLE